LQENLDEALHGKGKAYFASLIRVTIKGRNGDIDDTMAMATRVLAGAKGPAMIIYNLSSLLTQLLTSLPSSMTEMLPSDMLRGIALASNPENIKKINQYSAVMLTRTRDTATDKNMADENYKRKYGADGKRTINYYTEKLAEPGVRAFNWTDKVSVNPVWLGAYTRRAAELLGGKQFIADDIFDIPAEIKNEAVLHADLVINKTQPGNILYYQPEYMKNAKGLAKIFTMFQTPASVQLQQLFFDLTRKFGKGGSARKQAAWEFASFITMWLVVSFLKDDEKERRLEGDAEERIRKFLSYLLGSRAFQTIP
jgi:hypothetical protein